MSQLFDISGKGLPISLTNLAKTLGKLSKLFPPLALPYVSPNSTSPIYVSNVERIKACSNRSQKSHKLWSILGG